MEGHHDPTDDEGGDLDYLDDVDDGDDAANKLNLHPVKEEDEDKGADSDNSSAWTQKSYSPTFLSTSSTTTTTDEDDDDNEAPSAKRRRSLGDSEEAVHAFELKLASTNLLQAQSDHSVSYQDGPGPERQVPFRSRTFITPGSGRQPRLHSTNPIRDISDISSVSSFSSLSSNDMNGFVSALGLERNESNQRSSSMMQPFPTSPSPTPSDPPHFEVEFEVASNNSFSSNPIEDANSSSGLEENGFLNEDMNSKDFSDSESLSDDLDNFADEEEIDSDGAGAAAVGISDSELSDKDLWFCTQCHAKTNNPYLRYCLRCFRIRRNWLPKRPSHKKDGGKKAAKSSHSRSRRHTSSEEEQQDAGTAASEPSTEIVNELIAQQSTAPNTTFTTNTSASASATFSTTPSTNSVNSTTEQEQDLDVVDSGPKSSPPQLPNSQSLVPVPDLVLDTGRSRAQYPPAQPQTVNSQLLKDILTRAPLKIKSIRNSSSSQEEKETPLCGVCMVRDKDAAFVHGKTAHVYSCYNCADKILKKNGKCPICRKRILRVVKVINS